MNLKQDLKELLQKYTGVMYESLDTDNLIGEILDITTSEDIQMLERENQAMANVLLKLGYTNEQISDIANGAI